MEPYLPIRELGPPLTGARHMLVGKASSSAQRCETSWSFTTTRESQVQPGVRVCMDSSKLPHWSKVSLTIPRQRHILKPYLQSSRTPAQLPGPTCMKTKTCKHNKAVAQGVTRDQSKGLQRNCRNSAVVGCSSARSRDKYLETLRETEREGERESGLAVSSSSLCFSE